MKLCKICKVTKVVSNKFTYCLPCKKLKARKYHLKYKKLHPEKFISYKGDGKPSLYWVCKCGYFVPRIFSQCNDCKALFNMGRPKKFLPQVIFYPEKDVLEMDSFIESYFDRQNNGSTKPS